MVIRILIGIAIYLILGQAFFSAVINALGGKKEFIEDIGDEEDDAELVYLLCHLSVVIFWPLFITLHCITNISYKIDHKEDK